MKHETRFKEQVLDSLKNQAAKHREHIDQAERLLNKGGKLFLCTPDTSEQYLASNKFYAIFEDNNIIWMLEDNITYRDAGIIWNEHGLERRKRTLSPITWKTQGLNKFYYQISPRDYIEVDPKVLKGELSSKGIQDIDIPYKILNSSDYIKYNMQVSFDVFPHRYVQEAKYVILNGHIEMALNAHKKSESYICLPRVNKNLEKELNENLILRDLEAISQLESVWQNSAKDVQDDRYKDLKNLYITNFQNSIMQANNKLIQCLDNRAIEYQQLKDMLYVLLRENKEKLNQVQCRMKDRSQFRNQIAEYFTKEELNLKFPEDNPTALGKKKAYVERMKMLRTLISTFRSFRYLSYSDVRKDLVMMDSDNYLEALAELDFESFLEIESKFSGLKATIVNTQYLSNFHLTNGFFEMRSSNCKKEYSTLKNLLDRQGGKSLDQRIAQMLRG